MRTFTKRAPRPYSRHWQPAQRETRGDAPPAICICKTCAYSARTPAAFAASSGDREWRARRVHSRRGASYLIRCLGISQTAQLSAAAARSHNERNQRRRRRRRRRRHQRAAGEPLFRGGSAQSRPTLTRTRERGANTQRSSAQPRYDTPGAHRRSRVDRAGPAGGAAGLLLLQREEGPLLGLLFL